MSSEGESSRDEVEEQKARQTNSLQLSQGELEELRKTNPKRVKRILANRASAARSRVRKLRYIAELESKSAALQQQMTRLTTELQTLQESIVRLGSENEWLLSQVLGLQEHSNCLEEERHALDGHLLLPISQTQLPCMGARADHLAGFDMLLPSRQPQPGGISETNFAVSGTPQHQILSRLPSHSYFAAVTSHLQAGSGLSFTTHELQLQPENPALLPLLQNLNLGPCNTSAPSGLPLEFSGLGYCARSNGYAGQPLQLLGLPRIDVKRVRATRFG